MSISKQAEQIREISGVNPYKCMKCGKCSASCPSFNEMDIKPHQFVSYVLNDDIESLVNSKSLWKCLSCFACIERCPRDVKPGKLIDAARQLVVRRIATMLTASIDTNNFLTEAHAKLRPVESPTAGVFLSGVCQGPKDIPETVAQAGAAAVKAIGLLAKDKLMTNPCTAKSDELLCNGCSQCANVCPYGAISYETKLINDHGIREDRRVAVVNSALCQGCGACTVTCPSGAMDLQGFANRQILAEVDAICR